MIKSYVPPLVQPPSTSPVSSVVGFGLDFMRWTSTLLSGVDGQHLFLWWTTLGILVRGTTDELEHRVVFGLELQIRHISAM